MSAVSDFSDFFRHQIRRFFITSAENKFWGDKKDKVCSVPNTRNACRVVDREEAPAQCACAVWVTGCTSFKMAFRVLERSAERLKEGSRNQFRWDWLDRQVEECRVGHVIRKLDEEGVVFCTSCVKKIDYAKRGFTAISNHMMGTWSDQR